MGVLLVLAMALGMAGGIEGSVIPFDTLSHVRLTYQVTVQPDSAQVGKKMSLWIPYPREDENQKIIKFIPHSPWPLEIRKEEKYGNKMIYLEGTPHLKAIDFSFEYEIKRLPKRTGTKKISARDLDLYLKSNRLIPLHSRIEKIAQKEGARLNAGSKIRAFYNYVVKTMKYDKSGTGWGKGDAVWACDAKRGNCTDFHSLFIAMNRSAKIPARFEIGLPLPVGQASGMIGGYHCWAEAYDSERGWIPVDATEAKKTGMRNQYFGHLPSNRIEFTRGRDIVLNPPQKGTPLNYFIYPYAEVAGKSYTKVTHKFSFKNIKEKG